MLTAKPGCCEECAMGLGFSAYIPCNKPATKIVGWPRRGEKNLRMCDMCADHNIRNRGAELIGPYQQEQAMKGLVIDTETTGLFDFSKGAHEEGQPRMAHLAMIYVDGTETRERDIYIKPDGWVMPAEAGAINGLTTEFLMEHGVPVREALEEYVAAVKDGRVVIAYNAQYDTKVLRGELRRADMPDLFTETPNICVMRPCTNICKILKNNPRTDNDWKFPKLSEALEFFGLTNDAAHTGPADARAALAIYRQLEAIGELPEAKVHFATKRPDGAAAPKPSRKRAAKPGPVQADDQIPE